jgi:hypothetical protein
MTENFFFRDRSSKAVTATLTLRDREEPVDLPMQAELIVAARSGETLKIAGIRDIALWRYQLTDKIAELRYISIGGPTTPLPEFDPTDSGEMEMEVSLYYAALEECQTEQQQLCYEYMNAGISWQPDWRPGENGPHVNLRLDMALNNQPIYKGLITSLTIPSLRLFHSRLPGGLYYSQPLPTWFDLAFDTTTQRIRTLKLRFIAIGAAGSLPSSTAEEPVKGWIENAREVWQARAGLYLDIEQNIHHVPIDLDTKKEENEPKIPKEAAVKIAEMKAAGLIAAGFELSDRLNIYLVPGLNANDNGGIKHPKGAVTLHSYILLQVDAITRTDTYKGLLAHELGHIFGLAHPEAPHWGHIALSGSFGSGHPKANGWGEAARNMDVWRGTYGSVMMPSATGVGGKPSPMINPWSNLLVFVVPEFRRALASFFHDDTDTSGLVGSSPVPEPAWNPDPEPWCLWVAEQELSATFHDFPVLMTASPMYRDGMTPVIPHGCGEEAEVKLVGDAATKTVRPYVRLTDYQLLFSDLAVHLFLERANTVTHLSEIDFTTQVSFEWSNRLVTRSAPAIDVANGDTLWAVINDSPPQGVLSLTEQEIADLIGRVIEGTDSFESIREKYENRLGINRYVLNHIKKVDIKIVAETHLAGTEGETPPPVG